MTDPQPPDQPDQPDQSDQSDQPDQRDQRDQHGENAEEHAAGQGLPAHDEGAEVVIALEGDVAPDVPIAQPQRHTQGTAWTASGSVG